MRGRCYGVLDSEKFDFSEETDIKDKLLKACLDKKKSIEDKPLRTPISFEELAGDINKNTKIEANKSKENSIKIDKNK